MYEHRKHPLISRSAFIQRALRHLGWAAGLIAASLGIGIFGYHFIAKLGWIDSLLNASMILGGMGPVNPLTSDEAKLFASGYALLCGLIFIAVASLLVAPFAHRFLHRFHLDKT